MLLPADILAAAVNADRRFPKRIRFTGPNVVARKDGRQFVALGDFAELRYQLRQSLNQAVADPAVQP